MAQGRAAGGSVTLVELLRQHGEPIEADLQRYYNVDVRELFNRTPAGPFALTPRRALTLIRQLPHDAATVAALRGGPEFRGWTGDRYLLALVADLLQNLVYVQVAKSNPKRKPPKPEPLPRPGDRPAGKDGSQRTGPSLAEQASDMLRRKRNRELV